MKKGCPKLSDNAKLGNLTIIFENSHIDLSIEKILIQRCLLHVTLINNMALKQCVSLF